MPVPSFWILAIFFLSGLTGLVYEVAWAKLLGTLLGNTAQAHAIVLGTYLGGMSIGYALGGKRADRHPSRLRLYAQLEFGIAALAALSPFVLTALQSVYLGQTQGQTVPPALMTALHIGLAAAAMLPATILMGGTLPALARFLSSGHVRVERSVGALYAINSAGAVVGALLTGYVLLPVLGLHAAIWFAAVINVALGLGALRLARAPLAEAAAAPEAATADPNPVYGPLHVHLVSLAVMVTGFVALALELGWIRLLSLVLGSSAYSFTVMVAGFITGIALGSWVVQRGWLKSSAYVSFVVAVLGAGVALVVTLPGYEVLPYAFLWLRGLLAPTTLNFWLLGGIEYLMCTALMLLPTVLLGITLPAATRVVAQSVDRVGAGVGRVYAMNTLGSVLGAALAGSWLLPLLGLADLMRTMAAVLVVLAVALAISAPHLAPRRRAVVAVGGLVILAAQTALPSWNLTLMASGAYQGVLMPGTTFADLKQTLVSRDLLFYQDDENATISVIKEGNDPILRTNGKVDASAERDRLTQILLGQLPMLLKPDAQEVFMIGLGSGMSAGTILTHPVKRLDVVEISPGVVAASEIFAPHHGHPLIDPRCHVTVDDALHHLNARRSGYDVMISQPSNPWVAGVGNLFTTEFYEQAAKSLNPGGLMVQWCQAFEMDDEDVRLTIRTFRSVFPHVTVWQGLRNDLLLIGSKEPLRPDFAAAEARFATPEVQREFKRIGMSSLSTALSLQMLSEERVAHLVGDGRVNRIHHPVLEYRAPLTRFLGSRVHFVYDADQRRHDATGQADLLWHGYVAQRSAPLQPAEYLELVRYQLDRVSQPAIAKTYLDSWKAKYPQDEQAQWAGVEILWGTGDGQGATAQMAKLVKQRSGEAGHLYRAIELEQAYIQRQRASQQRPEAGRLLAYLAELEKLRPTLKGWFVEQRVQGLVACDRPGDAAKLLERADAAGLQAPNMVDLWLATADSATRLGQHDLARACLQHVNEAVPHHPRAQTLNNALDQLR